MSAAWAGLETLHRAACSREEDLLDHDSGKLPQGDSEEGRGSIKAILERICARVD